MKHLVGHTKNYTKVNIPFEEKLLYKQVMIKINKAFDWHVEGEIIDENLEPLKVDDVYAEMMMKDLEGEIVKLEEKKKERIAKMKLKK